MKVSLEGIDFGIELIQIKKASKEIIETRKLEIVEEKDSSIYLLDNEGYVKLKSINSGNALLFALEGESKTVPFDEEPFKLKIELEGVDERILGLTIYNIGCDYEKGFLYYAEVGLERTPNTPKPPDVIVYPREPSDRLIKTSCWTFPYIADDLSKVYPETVFIITRTKNKYLSILTLANRDLVSYIMPNLEINTFSGICSYNISNSYILGIGIGDNPYSSIRNLLMLTSKYSLLSKRDEKPVHKTINKIGWCSWNALHLKDLSADNIEKIVYGLINNGIPIKWVIVDDGWQVEEERELKPEHMKSGIISMRTIKSIFPRKDRFPEGFGKLIAKLKNKGVEEVGLWHTINIHWGGAYKRVFDELKTRGITDPNTKTSIPSNTIEDALDFYDKFYEYVRNNGFDFVKVDNQWYIKYAYRGMGNIIRSSRNLMLAFQLMAQKHGLWILNSMAMNPENYSYMNYSNVTRVSLDYIPFWRPAAKLHIMWSIYNSVFFSFITYPDYDMWMSYDPSAKLYAVASIMSGGPVYLTDRNTCKTNVKLLRRMILPNGEVVRVDSPALPTEDSLFIDPYNEPKLLKISSTVNGLIAVAVFNIYKDNMKISDIVDLSKINLTLNSNRYLYYKVFDASYGIVSSNDKISIELENNDAEIIIFSPIRNEKAIIGLKEYLLPPYPIKYNYANGYFYIKPKTRGTLLYFKENELVEKTVSENSEVIV